MSQLVFLLASADTILALMGRIRCHCSLSGLHWYYFEHFPWPLGDGHNPTFSLVLYVISLE